MQTTENIELVATNLPSLFVVKINLGFERRYIGRLDLAGVGSFITQRKPKHIFRNYGGAEGSLGINHTLLVAEDIPFERIVINLEKRQFETSRLYFLTHGKCFKFNSFELQCFLPISEFGLRKSELYEKSINRQFSLFEEVTI